MLAISSVINNLDQSGQEDRVLSARRGQKKGSGIIPNEENLRVAVRSVVPED